MRRAVVLTAYDRPHLLESTLESLGDARGAARWDLYLSLDRHDDPDVRHEVRQVAERWQTAFGAFEADRSARRFARTVIVEHDRRRGVLRHPYVVFEMLFGSGYDYVLRLEDDMRFTEDILEYHEWAGEFFSLTNQVGFVESRSGAQDDGQMNTGGHDEVIYDGFGSPLAIGTWPGVWREHLAPTWDHDYSTGVDGVQAGWDWNLQLRVYPERGLRSVRPLRDKVFHTGILGAHSTADIYELREPLTSVPEPLGYRVVSRRF